MAAQLHDTSNELGAMVLQDDEINTDNVLTLNNSVKLTDIKTNYESIFSWNIFEQVGKQRSLLEKLVAKRRDKCNYVTPEEEHKFDFHKFYFKLIFSFELYYDKKYDEALLEIKDVVSFMTLCTTDSTFKQYSKAFDHIALSTYAYIALSMNLDSEKIIESIKPIVELNEVEKSAIYAVKANVFEKYNPEGNNIALDFADQARTLNPSELEWIVTWLIAKARVRRFNTYNINEFHFPDDSELSAAKMLISEENAKSEFYLQSSRIYTDTARCYFNMRTTNEAAKYYTLSSNLLKKALLLEKHHNMKQLGYIFMDYIYLPLQYHSNSLVDEVLQELKNCNYYFVNFTLGKYYSRCKKDYQNAKLYFSRSMIVHSTFKCAMELFRVECLLQPKDQFKFVETLNIIYDSFLNPKKRCIILTKIIIYYYHEDNPKEVMRYLKLFMDQDIDDPWKKEHLLWIKPFDYGVRTKIFSYEQFKTYLAGISNNYEWSLEEKTMVIETFNRFNKIVGFKDTIKCNESNNENDKTFIGKLQNGEGSKLHMKLNQCEKQDGYQNSYKTPGNQTKHPFQHNFHVFNRTQNDGRSGELSWRNQKGRVVFKDKQK